MSAVKRQAEKGLRPLLPGLALALGLSFMLFLYAPYELYLTNKDDFWFTAGQMLPYGLGLFLAAMLVFALCFLLAARLSPKLVTLGTALLAFLLIGCYVQGTFLVAGLPGIMNDVLDRVLMRFINADPVNWRADLGVYQAAVKLAVIMQLFVQMFRYAAEPFFFQRERDKGGKKIYADVLNYFTAFCMFGFVALMLFMDEIGLILGKDFRVGLSITPIMLMAYVITGILFNVNIWYKLSEKTGYAVWITLAGLVVTIAVNLVFMPRYSYHAAAWGHIASYLTMLVLTALLGRRHYPIPYDWGVVILLVAAGLGVWGLSTLLPEMGLWTKIFVHCAFVLLYIAIAFVIFVVHKKKSAR